MKSLSESLADYDWCMKLALEEAEKGWKADEVPIGALVVSEIGEILARAHNDKEKKFNPFGHAEMIAMTEAAKKRGNWRLENCTLIVTLEPCPMCLAAMREARIGRVIFGAYDAKGGALSLNYNLHQDQRLNHRFEAVGGVHHFECSKILSDFFRTKRQEYKMKFP